MKRFIAVCALVLATASAVFAARAGAILYGSADGTAHPAVAYVVFYDSANVPLWRCSATLVTPTVLLTAGHCAGTYFNSTGEHTPARAQAFFSSTPIPSGDYPTAGGVPCTGFTGFPCTGGIVGAPVAYDKYKAKLRKDGTTDISGDLGAVVLAAPVTGVRPVAIAPVGTLQAAPVGSTFTIVGYGTQSTSPPPVDQRERRNGTVEFMGIDKEKTFADFTNDAAKGAAACFGDSGGPVLNGAGAIVAVISLVDSPTFCDGVAYHYRVDTVKAQQFLAQFGVPVTPGKGSEPAPGSKSGRDLGQAY
jgi:hypothetical protein